MSSTTLNLQAIRPYLQVQRTNHDYFADRMTPYQRLLFRGDGSTFHGLYGEMTGAGFTFQLPENDGELFTVIGKSEAPLFTVVKGKGDPRSHKEYNWFRFEEWCFRQMLIMVDEKIKSDYSFPYGFRFSFTREQRTILEHTVCDIASGWIEKRTVICMEALVRNLRDTLTKYGVDDWYSVERSRTFYECFALCRRDLSFPCVIFSRNNNNNFAHFYETFK